MHLAPQAHCHFGVEMHLIPRSHCHFGLEMHLARQAHFHFRSSLRRPNCLYTNGMGSSLLYASAQALGSALVAFLTYNLYPQMHLVPPSAFSFCLEMHLARQAHFHFSVKNALWRPNCLYANGMGSSLLYASA